jgi:hypothetical protein
MAARGAEPILGTFQGNGTEARAERTSRRTSRTRSAPMQTLTIAIHYARYLWTSLAAVAFGMSTN